MAIDQLTVVPMIRFGLCKVTGIAPTIVLARLVAGAG